MHKNDLPYVQEWLTEKLGIVEKSDTNEDIHQYLIAREKKSFVMVDDDGNKKYLLEDRPDETFEYLRIKTYLWEGDEVWGFHSGKGSFKALHGSAGIAVVRDGKVIEAIEIMCS